MAVDAWKAELSSKSRPKIAAAVAHPVNHANLFEENWAEALAHEGKLELVILLSKCYPHENTPVRIRSS